MPTAKLADIQAVQSPSNEGGKQEVPPVKPTESKGDTTRRITGSADIPLNAQGKKESKKLAESLSEKFDWVLSSPEKRAMQTAKEFGKAIPIEGLDAWKRGSLESQPVKRAEPAVKFLILHPDKRPSGVSPVSKEPGESLNEFARPLLSTIQTILAVMDKDSCGLVVCHGGNCQIIDQWAKDGKKPDLSFDLKAVAKDPYWSIAGDLFILGDNGLEEVKDNEQPGLYVCGHAQTDYNPG